MANLSQKLEEKTVWDRSWPHNEEKIKSELLLSVIKTLFLIKTYRNKHIPW